MTTRPTRQEIARQIQREFEEILANERGDTFEYDVEPATCWICDGIHGPTCPVESPDPGYYADEMAAGR